MTQAFLPSRHTDKKENEIFIIFKEIKMGSGYGKKLPNIRGNAQIFNHIGGR
jgi:hypothetical protein